MGRYFGFYALCVAMLCAGCSRVNTTTVSKPTGPDAASFAMQSLQTKVVANNEEQARQLSSPEMLAAFSHADFENFVDHFRKSCGDARTFHVISKQELTGPDLTSNFQQKSYVLVWIKADCKHKPSLTFGVGVMNRGPGWQLYGITPPWPRPR
jgi:hypothetical protein